MVPGVARICLPLLLRWPWPVRPYWWSAVLGALGRYNPSLFHRHSATQIHTVMSISMFVTGFVIFSIYLAFMVWNIINGHKSEDSRSQLDYEPDNLDADGMGNFSRFPEKKKKWILRAQGLSLEWRCFAFLPIWFNSRRSYWLQMGW